MAYQIDFTASSYTLRARRKTTLRLLAVMAAAAAVWGGCKCYTACNEPTLNMRLADYEAVAHPIEEVSAAWDEAAKEYDAVARYYRLQGNWSSSPTNFLAAMVAENAPSPGRGFRPTRWELTTGGACVLAYGFAFGPGDKAEQAKGLEGRIVNVVTSAVEVVGGRVDVQGVRHENLLHVDGFNVTAKFSLPNARAFPSKESSLAGCIAEIAAMRKKVQELKLANSGDDRKRSPEIQATEIMMRYLPMGKDKPGFPDMKKVIDVAGWFRQADAFILKNRIPVDDRTRKQLKETWNRVGEARFPWRIPWGPDARCRALDNEEMVLTTKNLGTVSDGVKRFKIFLEKHCDDNRKRLQPFVGAYDSEDIFNKDIVENDLVRGVAQRAGIAGARVAFDREAGAVPAFLVTDDEKFTFTWVRWTLSVGNVSGRGERERSEGEGGAQGTLTLPTVVDCIRRIQTYGPGYAVDKVKIDFGANGTVAGAVVDGLLPVKKVEVLEKKGGTQKKETSDVH